MTRPKTVIIAVVAFLILFIILQNTEVVTLDVFFWKISLSRFILLSIFFLSGMGAGYFLNFWLKKKKSIRMTTQNNTKAAGKTGGE